MNSNGKNSSQMSALVIGAGMVGVSVAIHLQRSGWSVTLMDRRMPGSETSFGNAGIISRGSIVPPNNPSIWRSLPAYLGNQHVNIRYDLRHLLANARWTLGFLRNALPDRTGARTKALDALLNQAAEAHEDLMQESGTLHRLRKTGWLRLARTEAGMQSLAEENKLYTRHGIASDMLSRDGVREAEPHIADCFIGGLMVHDTWSVDNPGAVTKAYARLFQGRGGRFLERRIDTLIETEDGITATANDGTSEKADIAVVALGPWSIDLLAGLGYRPPLGVERGYHRTLRLTGNATLTRPIGDIERGYVAAPMDKGVRITSGIELNHRDAAPNTRQIDQVVQTARGVLPVEDEPVDPNPWRGARPTLTDGLPAIGRVPGTRSVWCAFGHQHIGFTTGPITGQAIAALVNGTPPPFDPAPFRPDRFR